MIRCYGDYHKINIVTIDKITRYRLNQPSFIFLTMCNIKRIAKIPLTRAARNAIIIGPADGIVGAGLEISS